LEPEQFKQWRKNTNIHSLFFDGASKGNPGAAGGGGIILNPEEVVVLEYSWGIGEESNNIVRIFGSLEGLKSIAVIENHRCNCFW
jgi:ribonuclease HI